MATFRKGCQELNRTEVLSAQALVLFDGSTVINSWRIVGVQSEMVNKKIYTGIQFQVHYFKKK